MKKAGAKEIAAVVLVVLALGSLYYYYEMSSRGPEASDATAPVVNFRTIQVENPTLRIDKLRSIHSVQYTGRHRNIFTETMPPAELAGGPMVVPRQFVGPHPEPPPPPLVVNLKFFGYVDDRSSGSRRAFFTDGDENVFIASEGDTVENRYRLLKIRNDSVEMEELASGRRAVVMIEPEPGGPGPMASPGAVGEQR